MHFGQQLAIILKQCIFSRVIIHIYDNGDLKQIEAISGPDPVCRVREITYRISSNDSRQR